MDKVIKQWPYTGIHKNRINNHTLNRGNMFEGINFQIILCCTKQSNCWEATICVKLKNLALLNPVKDFTNQRTQKNLLYWGHVFLHAFITLRSLRVGQVKYIDRGRNA